MGCPKFRKEFDYTKPDNYSVHKALNNLAHANGQDESCPYECRVNHKQNRSDNITPTVVTAFMLSGNTERCLITTKLIVTVITSFCIISLTRRTTVNVVPTYVHQDLIEYRRDRFYTCPKKRSFLISCRHIFAFVLRNIQSRSRDGQQ